MTSGRSGAPIGTPRSHAPPPQSFELGRSGLSSFGLGRGQELLLVLYLRFEGTKDNFSQITKIIASCFRMVGRHAGPKAFPFFMVKMTVIYWNAL